MCGMGETVATSSPTLVLSPSPSKSQDALNNSEAQFVVKPPTNANPSDVDVTSQSGPISFTMFEQMFNGNLLLGKGTESNIFATRDEWVVHCFTDMRGVIHPPFLEAECKSPNPVISLQRNYWEMPRRKVKHEPFTIEERGNMLSLKIHILREDLINELREPEMSVTESEDIVTIELLEDGTVDTRVQEVEIHLSEDTLSIILDVSCKGLGQ
ncbi:hypothetical protein H5410_036573 [Solanum commersonii]|uniref:Uncharacterized protein n=1 Tax=Solanum commersonii TaxID=4109 RepID=A0A9J5Y585_SOLCO|nr:hypothetical protein H5410_036573 [Solanum commersonii]